MKIRIDYGTQVRALSGKQHELLEIPDSMPLWQFLEQLASSQSTRLQPLLKEDKHWQPGVLFFVNDQAHASNSNYKLHEGDEVALMTLVSGG